MRIHSSIVCLLAFSCLAPVAAAAGADNPAAEIAPFVNEQTLAAGRLDLTRLDFDALDKWTHDALAQSNLPDADRKMLAPKLHDALAGGKHWAEQFKQAGGRTIWVVFTLETFPRSAPVFFVVPLGPNSDADTLKKLFENDRAGGAKEDQSIARIHDALVGTPDPGGLEIIKGLQAQDRPDLAKALGEAGDAPLQIVLIPTADARKVVESMAPPLPQGQSITALTRGLVWAAAGVRFPPDASAHAVVQSESHEAAEAMQNLLKTIVRAAHEQRPTAAADPYAAKLLGPLVAAAMMVADRSRAERDRVVVELNGKDMTTVASGMGVLVHRMREQSARAVTSSNERQLLLGCVMYADQHHGEFPDSLEQAAKEANVAAEVLVNPLRPDQKPAYTYVKPAEGTKSPPDRLVLYETFDQFGSGVSVGFADGHVEWVGNEAAFQKLVKAARDAEAAPPAEGAPGERK
jgi:prepilin-type processing-associated H-X9-DG protein